MKRITILDTTLRDGEQAPGNSMTLFQKVELALMLEDAGVDCIELGFPASSKTDYEASKFISSKLNKTNYATFSRANINDIKLAIESGGVSERHTVQIVATGSDLHLKNKRKITREQGLIEVKNSVSFAFQNGIKNIALGIEDASRADLSYMKLMIDEGIKSGANQIIVADTTGFATPTSFSKLIKMIRSWLLPNIKLSTHCHNDLGLALPNALAGIESGADEVQVTLGGIGERAGNTSLEELAAILYYKKNDYEMFTNIQIEKLYGIYNLLRKFIQLEEPRNKPIFGKYTFSTAAGIHQQGMILDPNTYEYVKPEHFSRERSMFISRYSGRNIIKYALSTLDIYLDPKKIDELYFECIETKSANYFDNFQNLIEILKNEINIPKQNIQ